MTQEMQTAAPAVTTGAQLPERVADLSNVQRGWLIFAGKRMETVEALTRYELEVQQLVRDALGNKDAKAVGELLKTAKAKAAEGKDCRLQFTRILEEKLIAKLMEYEKRNEAAIAPLVSHELELRKAAVAAAGQIAQKQQEAAQLKAHVENEHARRLHQYRKDLGGMVVDAYKNALGQAINPKAIPEYLQTIRKFITEHKAIAFNVFQRRFVSDAEAKEIFNNVQQPDLKAEQLQALTALQTQFAMYEEDLQNAQAAIQQAEEAKAAQDKHEDEALQTDIHTNTLIAQAATVTGIAGVKVTKKYEAVEENTDEWALTVCGVFMGNFSLLKQYVTVKNMAKLTVGQMAAAIAKLKTERGGTFDARIKFKEVTK